MNPNDTAVRSPGEAPPSLPREARALLADSEAVVLSVRPSPWSILLVRAGWLALIAGAAVVWLFLTGARDGRSAWRGDGMLLLASTAALLLIWRAVAWSFTSYIMTDRRLVRVDGVFHRLAVEVPLQSVQNLYSHRLLRERLFGLGTLGFSKFGSERIEVIWTMLAHHDQILREVNRRRAEAGGQAPATSLPAAALEPPHPSGRVPVIGLVGGVGAGKSSVAECFRRAGCIVSDSDRQAKELLDEPEVRAKLKEWWGGGSPGRGEGGIIGLDGRVDRGALARLVFEDPAARARLEGLIHPILHARRRALIQKVNRQPAPRPRAIIVDAPLLFEAGVDRECDAVVFVEAPRDARLARVHRTRGWSEAELSRRENAQLPLDEKRRRAGFVVQNDGSEADLKSKSHAVLESVLSAFDSQRSAG